MHCTGVVLRGSMCRRCLRHCKVISPRDTLVCVMRHAVRWRPLLVCYLIAGRHLWAGEQRTMMCCCCRTETVQGQLHTAAANKPPALPPLHTTVQTQRPRGPATLWSYLKLYRKSLLCLLQAPFIGVSESERKLPSMQNIDKQIMYLNLYSSHHFK